MILNNQKQSKNFDPIYYPCFKLGEIVETPIIDNGEERTLIEFKYPKRVPHIDQSLSADMFSIDYMVAAGIPLGKEVGNYISGSAAAQVRQLNNAVASIHESRTAAQDYINSQNE